MGLPYAFGERKDVLLLNPNTGLDIGFCLTNKAKKIVAIAPNAMITSLLKNEDTHFTDSLFYHPSLQLHAIAPQTFLARNKNNYDLIQLPLLGEFGGGVGLEALKETPILTKEAFTDMWNSLNPTGVIAVSTWLNPERTSFKYAATIATALEDLKVDQPLNHVVAIQSWSTISFVVKKTPFVRKDMENIQAFCTKLQFDLTLFPQKDPEKVGSNAMADGI